MERFVKYFDPRYEDDVHLGRFMAGTTVSYCAKEKYSDLIQGLLSDEAEGSIILNYDIEPAYVEKFVSPLFTFINSVTPGIKMKIKAQANDHLFCGARGKYNREHHLKIVNGIRVNDRIIYPSNPNYTMFCEINFSRFLCSLKEAAGGVVRPQNDFTPQVIWANVRYTKHPKEIRFSGVLPKRPIIVSIERTTIETQRSQNQSASLLRMRSDLLSASISQEKRHMTHCRGSFKAS